MTMIVTISNSPVPLSSLAAGSAFEYLGGVYLVLDPANMPPSPGNVWDVFVAGVGSVPGKTYPAPGSLMVNRATVTVS